MKFLFKISFIIIFIFSVFYANAQCSYSIDFRNWQLQGNPTYATWIISSNGDTIEQTKAYSYTSFYVSPQNYLINVELEGKMHVNDPSDDDFLGLVCGYISPTSATGYNDFYTHIVDWKQAYQTVNSYVADAGYTLFDIHGTTSDITKYFFGHTDDAMLDVWQSNTGAGKGWANDVEYNVKLIYKTSEIIFIVDNDTVIDYNGCFDAGKIGIYNFSQMYAKYYDFSFKHIVDFDYQPVICQNDTAFFTYIDLNCAPNFDASYISQMYWDFGDGSTTTNTNVSNSNINLKHIYTTAGTYNVSLTVTDTSGCSETTTKQIIVNPIPYLSTASNSPLCEGDTLQLSTTDYSGASYFWYGPNGFTDNSNNVNIPNVQLSDSGKYYVIAQLNGCISPLDSVNVRVNNIPTSTFDFTQILCYSDSTTLTYTGDGNSTATLTWDYNGGTANGNYVFWTDEGNHDVTLTVTEDGCSSSTTQTITNPDSLYSDINVTDVKCFGGNDGQITANGQGGTPGYSYSWSSGSSNNLSAGTYTLTVTDANNCKYITNIEVGQPDLLTVSTNNDTIICSGAIVNLLATANGGTQPYNYFWNSINSTAYNIVQPQQTTTYQIQVIDANNCQSNVDSVRIIVKPPVNLTLLQNTDSVCPGSEVIITPIVTQGDGGPYSIFDTTGVLISPPVALYPDSSMIYILTAQDHCGSKDRDTAFIHILPLPDNEFYFDKNSICQNEAVQFNEVSAHDSLTRYVWNFGDNNNLSYIKNPLHTYDEAGVFNVSLTVTSKYGCSKTVTQNNAISVHENPIADFSASSELVSIIKPEVIFENYSSITDSCLWTFDDGDTLFTVSPIHLFKDTGEYNVRLVVTSNFGCKDSSSLMIKVTDINTIYAPTAFTPDFDGINDEFLIKAHGINTKNFNLSIYNRFGEEIFNTKDINKGWTGINKNGKVMPEGTYVWKAVIEDFSGSIIYKSGNVVLLR